MDWMMVGGCVVGAWAMLSVLGGERQRLINELPPPAAPEPEPAPPAKAAPAKPAAPKKH